MLDCFPVCPSGRKISTAGVLDEDGLHHEGTKDTKGSDNENSELRALRAFVVIKSSSILPTGRDKGRKNSPVRHVLWREHFGMPLHADDKTVARAFDPFDHAVVGDGVGNQTFAKLFDRLVMAGVDLEAAALNDGA